MSAFDHDDFADLDEYDLEHLDGLADDELAAAIEALHGPQPDADPLDVYATPVTRRRKPSGAGRAVHDVLYTL